MLCLASGETGSRPKYTSNSVLVSKDDLTMPTCRHKQALHVIGLSCTYAHDGCSQSLSLHHSNSGKDAGRKSNYFCEQ